MPKLVAHTSGNLKFIFLTVDFTLLESVSKALQKNAVE